MLWRAVPQSRSARMIYDWSLWGMGEATNKLMGLHGSSLAYTVAFADTRAMQIAALNERLQERVDRIKLVGLRARDARISEIRDFADVVPLLLPHTAYKSYPESVL